MLSPADHFEEIKKNLSLFILVIMLNCLNYVKLNHCQFPGEGKTHSGNVLYSGGIIFIFVSYIN